VKRRRGRREVALEGSTKQDWASAPSGIQVVAVFQAPTRPFSGSLDRLRVLRTHGPHVVYRGRVVRSSASEFRHTEGGQITAGRRVFRHLGLRLWRP
jgi:hypothetical protein